VITSVKKVNNIFNSNMLAGRSATLNFHGPLGEVEVDVSALKPGIYF